MTNAPKKLIVKHGSCTRGEAMVYAYDYPGFPATEYIRADLATPTPAEAARVLLGAVPNPILDQIKAILIGEHYVNLPDIDDDGEDYVRKVNVPWTVQKEIIADALRAIVEGITND